MKKIAPCTAALALVAALATPMSVYATEADDLAADIDQEQQVAEKVETAVDAFLQDPTNENAKQALSPLESDATPAERDFDDTASSIVSAQYTYAQLQLDLAQHQRGMMESTLNLILQSQQGDTSSSQETDELMESVRDHMQQYNQYLTGASGAIDAANKTLESIAGNTSGSIDSAANDMRANALQNLINGIIGNSTSSPAGSPSIFDIVDQTRADADDAAQKMQDALSKLETNPTDAARKELEFQMGQYGAMMDNLSTVADQMSKMLKSVAQETGTIDSNDTMPGGLLACGIAGGAVLGAGATYLALRKRLSARPSQD